MTKWNIRYTKIPTNFNDAKNAVIEAETAADAKVILRHALGQINGVMNYVIEEPRPWEAPPTGHVVTLNAD